MSVEEPAFRLRLRKGNFEVRDYPALAVAEVVVAGDQKRAAGEGFRILAGYIFGANARRERIAMTAPVAQSRVAEKIGAEKIGLAAPLVQAHGAGEWLVRFTMPKGSAVDALPAPKDARVRLRVAPQVRCAVIRFSGLAEPHEVAARAAELDTWTQAHHLRATEGASLAQYDPPWTLWFLRRNEVIVPVAA